MILDRLERMPVGSFHYKLLLVTGLGWLFDSMDTGLIAFVLPVLAKEWGLSPEQMGWIGSIGLIGMALGAVISGTLADRIGRKKVFTITVLMYALATGMCALAWSYESLLFFRFLVGFGLGGELPVAATLMSEYAPTKLRGRFIVLLESFWGIGWLVAACISYLIIPQFGWKIAFVIGTLPALYVFLIRLHMPESVRYLISKNKIEEAKEIILDLEKKLHVISKPFEKSLTAAEMGSTNEKTPGPLSLFNSSYMKRTIMLWLAWFGIVYSYYGIFMWLPSIVFQQGFAVVKTFEYVLIMTIAQLPGYYCAAWLVDVIGRKYTLSIFLLMSGVASYFFGNAASPETLLLWGATMSFFNLGAWGVIYTYTPELYPTSIRALGSGWAAGFGRIGGMIAPALVGIMLANQLGIGNVFLMFAGVLIVVSLVVLTMGVETRQRQLEDISFTADLFKIDKDNVESVQ
ncbi:MAG: MFS transporter [Anaerovibrio sp.]|uniref:Major facilitator transporter n=3 Tax=Anaerovibrio lipolyticus TaxID=82374 RepID=A0A0B2JNJ1_9FIRM|nr:MULTISPECIES: MFS transporter [Anaerovibrio]KHM49374.1 major facilitator transporter [Anaerovibrio lipolyticus]MBO6245667.1 MFS transporter [Anaerovibrio sp.]SHJ03670.1 MFS transporter, putative metabolite:H+ symporter [Anaerovibrio lipolyticus DSM 3074]